ncbi:aspartate--ammonia ligase [Mycoplasma miroungirhinis]|uniref:Aspartate--ammonia ligase n=1 Tax=Mycoplasma miroungirhinis TaxID=754516 RepID=A0A6M4JIU8_9MOLU|nr:aspartate--ammonia ligase [Mycoplasma miroungirhinis]QJR44401.1 aspartate--ammonia ligase [Mycoplasma miroungirhinis]
MYKPLLNINETQYAIAKLKSIFSLSIAKKLNLIRVSAPLFLTSSSRLNDGLNGEKPVVFSVKDFDDKLEIVHSLAKWKRQALANYNFKMHTGLYCDMNAIRREEELDFLHSIYVDQWDWELIIAKEERNKVTLQKIAKNVFDCLKTTDKKIRAQYPQLSKKLPNKLFFISSSELQKLYPHLTPDQREYEIVKKHKAVFITEIGHPLADKVPHSLRAKDYDDWNLNGDLIVYHAPNDCALEISSMGIRVDDLAIINQYKKTKEDIENISSYHSNIVNSKLPYTVGGGLGQSRIAMFLLEKQHIGEVQVSIWSDQEKQNLKNKGINLL